MERKVEEMREDEESTSPFEKAPGGKNYKVMTPGQAPKLLKILRFVSSPVGWKSPPLLHLSLTPLSFTSERRLRADARAPGSGGSATPGAPSTASRGERES